MRTFPAKLLLLGEYAILHGAFALAVPFHRFSAHWATCKGDFPHPLQKDLPALAAFLESNDDLRLIGEQLLDDLRQGYYISSTLPVGYGLGSSGVVSAAVLDRAIHKLNQVESTFIRPLLADIESFYHAQSSGIDPYISMVDKALCFTKSGATHPVSARPPQGCQLFLIDTGITRRTGPLVKHYLRNCENTNFLRSVEEVFLPATNEAVLAYQGETAGKDLFKAWDIISHWQLEHLSYFIPSQWQSPWKKLLDSSCIRLKLCGAGGGGYLLGLSYGELPFKLLKDWPVTWLEGHDDYLY